MLAVVTKSLRPVTRETSAIVRDKGARPVIVTWVNAVSDASAPMSQVTPLRLESSSSLLPHHRLVNAAAENGSFSIRVSRPPRPISLRARNDRTPTDASNASGPPSVPAPTVTRAVTKYG